MNPKSLVLSLAIVTFLFVAAATPVTAVERTMYLNVCQELVTQARAYEARATQHNSIAKAFQMQIENLAKMPKTQSTVTTMDSLFSQYDQNRLLEIKFRELYRQTSDEAERCMKRLD